MVTKDVPPYAIVAGTPAKIIDYRFEKSKIDFLLSSKWWSNEELTKKMFNEYKNLRM
ncbi:hypothetical protein [Bacillus methanolicus]|uniref:hypothetical protein n=1 Tax=Bacillus methanolicus TaxID=1471 RepID=UPI003D80A620